MMPIFDEIGNTLKGAAKYIENSPLKKLLNGPATCDAKIGLLEMMEEEGFEFGENAIGAAIESTCQNVVTMEMKLAIKLSHLRLASLENFLPMQFTSGPKG